MQPAKISALLILLCANCAYAQVKPLWQVKNPFEQKVFIENNAGQFDKLVNNNEKILFTAYCNGAQLLFTASGILYRCVQLPEEKRNEEDKKTEPPKVVFFKAGWVGTNESVQVMPEEETLGYNCYVVNKHNIRAHNFKRILYKNIYKDIDIEYFFPADSGGMEYRLIVYPGGNLAEAALAYSGIDKIIQDGAGNIELKTAAGELVDHAPGKTFYTRSPAPIFCRMVLNGNEIRFDAGNYDKSKTLVIDPWQNNAGVYNYVSPYDLCTDNNGNVCVYGDGKTGRLLAKFDSSGTFLWSTPLTRAYGDFTVDKINGTIFIGSGIDITTSISKISPSGALIDSINVSNEMAELWRMDYNSCNGMVLVAGGGVEGYKQAAVVDTQLTSCVEYNVLGTTAIKHDMEVLCTDKYAPDCYMASAKSQDDSLHFNNVLLKCPVPNLSSVAFMVPDGFIFRELSSIDYNPNAIVINGMNGITAGLSKVCIYDGSRIGEFDKSTGAFVKAVTVGPSHIGAYGQIVVTWGGIASDKCGNIYVGYQDSIIVYDSSLTRQSAFLFASKTDTVYDVQVGINSQLYACGKNAVCAYSIASFSKGLVKVGSPACSGCNGTAYVYLPCVTGSASYSWSNGDTTQYISNLCAGTYSVTVKVGCEVVAKDTVNISPSGNPSVNIPSDSVKDVSCYGGNNGSAYAMGSGGAPPYTYKWFPQDYNGDSVSNLSAGVYTVIVTDTNGCAGINTVIILQPQALAITTNPHISINERGSTTLTATASGGTPPYTFTWNDTVQGASVTVSPSENSTYTVVVTDSNGCKAAAIVTVDILCGNIFVPDAFSPNGDGQNDILRVRGHCVRSIQFFVFDRWGNKVFESENESDGWDGRYKGQLMNTGTYVWYLKATLQDGSTVEKKGSVALVR